MFSDRQLGNSSVITCILFVSQVYGGYVTSLLVSGEESPVKCGAVLSPITDFELYGKLYTDMQKTTVSVLCGKQVRHLCFVIQAVAVLSESIQKGKEKEKLQI